MSREFARMDKSIPGSFYSDKFMTDFEKRLNAKIKKCQKLYDLAENALSEVTLVLQEKYPNLEATISGNEIFYLIKNNENGEEYYSLEDIERRYELKK